MSPDRLTHSLKVAAASAGATGLFLASLLGPPLPTAFASSYAISPGTLNLTATFNSIGVELLFTGDDNANASAALDFKPSSTTAWRQGLPLWRTDDGSTSPGRAFYGSALLLDPATAYDVRVTLTDPDGVAGSAVITRSITTRTDNIATRASLFATYFVTATGNDSNAGTSLSSAWRTIDKALRYAPAGAVVQVGPGYFKNSNYTRTKPITLIAQYPAVDDSQAPINPGKHTVIDSAADSGPAADTMGAVQAPWQKVTFVDSADFSKSYIVWEWAAAGVSKATQLGYASSRSAEPKRLANWAADSLELSTPAGWAKKLYTNKTYNYGFYAPGQDIYLRLPGDVNPNTLYVSVGNGYGLRFDGPSMRVSGFEVRQFGSGVWFGPHASFGVVDHSQFVANGAGVSFQGLAGTPPTYGADHVIQNNRFADSSLWTTDHISDPGIPWSFIKLQIVNADGTLYPTRRLGGASETEAVGSNHGGAHRVVVRYNTMDGGFNGVSFYPGDWTDRYANQDTDVHNNLIKHIPDDSLEPSGQNINFRAWNNRIEDASDVLSSDPLKYGPVYLFRNEGWRLGPSGVPFDAQGTPTMGKSAIFKYDDGSTVQGRIYVLHNTLWTDPSLSTSIANGGADYGSGSGGFADAFYLRNNIIHVTDYAFVVKTAYMWNEDYNDFSTTALSRGVQYLGQYYTTSVSAYRVASGQGAHTNISNDFVTAPSLANPLAGDLSLPSGSPLIDAGVAIPNLSDRPGVDFRGAAPDLGATEY